jgi:hypothetical protein
MNIAALTVASAGLALAVGASASEGAGDGGLVVVAPAAMRESLDGFIAHKKHSLEVSLVTLEDAIKREPGVDDAESLKKYLYKEWKERHIRYVLLVGDADVMPVRFMALDRVTPEAFDYAFYPSDLYYADVARSDGTFDDWNGNKEGFHAGYFGEVRGEKNKGDAMNYDGVSYVPELALGRWPVSTAEQARAVAAKTIAYDEAMSKGEVGAKVGAVVPAGGGDARGALREMVSPLGAAGWRVEERYYSDTNEAFKTGAPDEANTVGMLNDGVSLLLHAGHGSDTTWERCFSERSIAKLSTQKHAAVMISAGCSTGRFCTLPPYEPYVDVHGVEHKGTNAGEKFDAPPPPPLCYAKGKYNMTGLGEELVRAVRVEKKEPGSENRGTQGGGIGAICYIGCNTGAQPCAVTLEREFVGALVKRGKDGTRVRVGDCWADAVGGYYASEKLATLKPTEDWYPASIFFQGMKFMMYGDPTVEMATGKGEK